MKVFFFFNWEDVVISPAKHSDIILIATVISLDSCQVIAQLVAVFQMASIVIVIDQHLHGFLAEVFLA